MFGFRIYFKKLPVRKNSFSFNNIFQFLTRILSEMVITLTENLPKITKKRNIFYGILQKNLKIGIKNQLSGTRGFLSRVSGRVGFYP